MKRLSLHFIIIATLLTFFSTVFTPAQAQRSVAELIASMAPPKGIVNYKDGVRQITILDNSLFVTNYWGGLQVFNISDINNPQQIVFLPSEDESYCTFLDGDYAYLASHSAGVLVYDIKDIKQIKKVAQIKPPGNTFWVAADGAQLFVALGKEGFVIMDVSDFNNPVTLKLEIPGSWVQQLFKKGNYLYVAAKKDGVLVYDISDLENPILLSRFKTDFNTMMVQVVEDKAYIADGAGGMLILNVANPAMPSLLSRFSDIGFVGSLYQSGNYAYLANRDVGLQIVNISNPAQPFLESRFGTDDICYGVFKIDTYVFLAANTSTLIMRHNNAPVLEKVGDLNLKENISFSYQLVAHERDGDPFLYEAHNLPENASFDPATGYMAWTPNYDESGEYKDVIFKVVEETGSRLSTADTVTIFVEHVNRRPDLPVPELNSSTVNENFLLTFTLAEGSDPDREDQQRLAYSAEKLPDGAIFDPGSRTFSWTPTFEQSGTYVIDFVMNDGAGGFDREPVTITVNHVDRKPAIDSVAAVSAAEKQPVSIQITGQEPDQEDKDKISFTMRNLPEGASFDPVSQIFSWTPSFEQSGVYNNIIAIMTAGNLSDTTTVAIAVDHVNRAPVMANIPDQTVDENQILRFTVSSSDPDIEDAGKLSNSASNLPEGASFNIQTSMFEWQPNFEQSGEYSNVTFAVTDPSGLIGAKSILITVNHVNRAPAITAVDDQSVNENSELTIQLSGSDPDSEDVASLVFSGAFLPEGATINARTGKMAWTPAYDQSGEYQVTFSISDGEYSASTDPVTLTVLNVNRAPILNALDLQTGDENSSLTFLVNGNDPDLEDNGLLTYTAQDLPEGADFNPATRTFTWTPDFEQSGQYQVLFSIMDPAGLSDQKPLNIVINNVNRSPLLDEVTAQVIDENQSLNIQLQGSDPDQEDAGKLIYEVQNFPEGVQLDPATGLLQWTPSFDQSGEYNFSAQVKDAGGLSSEQNIVVTVNNVNRAPKIEPPGDQHIKEGETLTLTMNVSDPDNKDSSGFIFEGKNLPVGADFDKNRGLFTWKPGNNQQGAYQVEFVVKDAGGLTDKMTISILVEDVPEEPTIPPDENEEQ